VSGIAASVAAFLVVSRWNLAGTLTGAAIMPVIYILVSHSSLEGLDGLGRWTRRRVRGAASSADESGRASAPTIESAALGKAGEAESEPLPTGRHMTGRRVPRPSESRAQWLLAGVACLALVVSAYSVVLRPPAEETIVRETVVEKTVTVPSGGARAVALDSGEQAGGTTTSAEAGSESTDGAPGTTADPSAEQPETGTETPSTTATPTTAPGLSNEEDPPPPTTTEVETAPTSVP
jgi:hypothetical protein